MGYLRSIFCLDWLLTWDREHKGRLWLMNLCVFVYLLNQADSEGLLMLHSSMCVHSSCGLYASLIQSLSSFFCLKRQQKVGIPLCCVFFPFFFFHVKQGHQVSRVFFFFPCEELLFSQLLASNRSRGTDTQL